VTSINEALTQDAVGLRLCYIDRKEDLRLYPLVTFARGRPAVELILRRAAICGAVEIDGENGDYFADIFIDEDSWTQTVALDKGSFRYLRNKMRPGAAIGSGNGDGDNAPTKRDKS